MSVSPTVVGRPISLQEELLQAADNYFDCSTLKQQRRLMHLLLCIFSLVLPPDDQVLHILVYHGFITFSSLTMTNQK